jgi:hypothetical protein
MQETPAPERFGPWTSLRIRAELPPTGLEVLRWVQVSVEEKVQRLTLAVEASMLSAGKGAGEATALSTQTQQPAIGFGSLSHQSVELRYPSVPTCPEHSCKGTHHQPIRTAYSLVQQRCK